MNDYDHRELVIRLRNDDVEAFNTLYWKYHTALYANILKQTRDAIIAEDVLQEVFIALWEKRHTLDSEQSVSGWLFVVSFNKSVDRLKQKLRESLIQKSAGPTLQEVFDENIDLADNRLDIIKKAIEELSPQKRKVFELCKMKRMTYEEVAKELQISKHTVKEYLSAAISSIKEYIQKHRELRATFVFSVALANYLS